MHLSHHFYKVWHVGHIPIVGKDVEVFYASNLREVFATVSAEHNKPMSTYGIDREEIMLRAFLRY